MTIYNVLLEHTNFEDEDNNYSEIRGSFSNEENAMKYIYVCISEEYANDMINTDTNNYTIEELIQRDGYLHFEQKNGYGETRIILSENKLNDIEEVSL